jgi:SAM-dependent methyltransferase
MQTLPNTDQVAYWNSPVGERWAALQDEIDVIFAPLTRIALDQADARPGERAVDVGCGCGTTTLELAKRIMPAGTVLAVDISKPMLEVAKRRAHAAGLDGVTSLLADASTHAFMARSHDLVFSRFGVMFFEDPVVAFANIRTALRPSGRLLFVCWRPMAENAWFNVPLQAALPHLPPQPATDPHAPGPFAFADPDRVGSILDRAGFSNVDIAPHDIKMRLASPGEIDAAASFATKIGPTARLLAETDEETRKAALTDIRAALAGHDGRDGVVLGGAIWIVSARNA